MVHTRSPGDGRVRQRRDGDGRKQTCTRRREGEIWRDVTAPVMRRNDAVGEAREYSINSSVNQTMF